MMRTSFILAFVIGTAAAAPAAAFAEPDLIGTQWRLVSFQSSDGGTGAVQPGSDESYTLRLDADGLAALQLYCNRGMGRWHMAGGSRRGRLAIDDLSLTRASCPESPLERITEDLRQVRRYVIENGRLHLSLRGDGGTYVWEAVP